MSNPATDTRWLTHARFEPAALDPGRQRRWLGGGLVVLLVLLLAGRGFVGDLFGTARDLAAARQAQAELTAEVERLTMQLAVETATRGEVEQQAAALDLQVEELTRQLEFLTTRRPAGGRSK